MPKTWGRNFPGGKVPVQDPGAGGLRRRGFLLLADIGLFMPALTEWTRTGADSRWHRGLQVPPIEIAVEEAHDARVGAGYDAICLRTSAEELAPTESAGDPSRSYVAYCSHHEIRKPFLDCRDARSGLADRDLRRRRIPCRRIPAAHGDPQPLGQPKTDSTL